ncbi:MAG: ABC transporter permease [Cyclobacteriaceae bacterium]|nr:ABC transporter permease [Cyclobacteriaceae bacterium]
MRQKPPKWADRLLKWYCKPERLEDLQGDLIEYFERNLQTKGPWFAQISYVLEVFYFMRLYAFRKFKPQGTMYSIHLLANYWKTSIRNIARNKLFSTINIVGLGISMSVGIVMIVFLAELLSYDKFHRNGDHIYRLVNTHWDHQQGESRFASTSALAGYKLMDSHSAIRDVVLFRKYFKGIISWQEKSLAINGLYASENFFSLFSFDLLKGDPNTALKNPNSLVITESFAKKMFGEENPLGQMVSIQSQYMDQAVIAGVVADPPLHSHIQFNSLVSFSTFENKVKANDDIASMFHWNNMWMYHVYFRLADEASEGDVQKFLDEMSAEQNEGNEYVKINLGLQKLGDIIPGDIENNSIGPYVSKKLVLTLLLLTGLVLLAASFNYTNLSVARALGRAREVGVRKVLGATKAHIFTQFIFEALILTLLATCLAFCIFYFVRDQWLQMGFFSRNLATLDFQIEYLVPLVAFALIMGTLSGFLPSFLLARTRVLQVLKNKIPARFSSGPGVQIFLIVFQYVLSIAFIIGATISYKQFIYTTTYDLGFATENILTVNLWGNDADLVKKGFSEVPEIGRVSASGILLSTGEQWGEHLKYEDPHDSIIVYLNTVDEHYIDLYDIPLLAGSNFRHTTKDSEVQQVMVNEKLLERFDLGTPTEAVGKRLKVEGNQAVEIVGVIPNIQYATVESETEPFLLKYQNEDYQVIGLKINSPDLPVVIEKLEKAWDNIDPIHPFTAHFYQDRISETYKRYYEQMKMVGFLAFLSIVIAAMGMLGMAVYTTESRMKEVSIRKVLGASAQQLVVLLSSRFIWMILAASLIAVPATYFVFEQMVLRDHVHRITIGLFDLTIGTIIPLFICVIIISWQVRRIARTNPSDTLRDE